MVALKAPASLGPLRVNLTGGSVFGLPGVSGSREDASLVHCPTQ